MHFHKNIRFIKQKDSMQCGVASLCMICNYMGIKCSTESLEKKCSGKERRCIYASSNRNSKNLWSKFYRCKN